MPRYHFDWALGDHRARDAEGVDLADEDAARVYAQKEISELLETMMGKRLGDDCFVEVCDDKRHMLFKVARKDT